MRLTPIDPSQVHGENFLQSSAWGELKRRTGWKPYAFSTQTADGSDLHLLVLVRKLAHFLPMAYVPWGPDSPFFDEHPEQLAGFLRELSDELVGYLPMGTFFIRYDLPQAKGAPLGRSLHTIRFHVQPDCTTILDITPSLDEILAGMKKKTRYNIRLAEKKGLIISDETDENGLKVWHKMLQQTAQRDGILIHNFSYYNQFTQLYKEKEGELSAHLYLARSKEGVPLAGILVIYYKSRATYLYGASANTGRELMPSYALQWHAIQKAKEAGIIDYDFFGIPRPEEKESSSMSGLWNFKVGFGGAILVRAGARDYAISKVAYPLFRQIEGARQWMIRSRKRLKKRA